MKPDKGNNNGNNNKRNIMGLVSIIFWALLFTMMIKSCTSSYANMGTVEVPYTTFKEWLAEDKIDTVNVENGKYTFTLRDGVEVELPREETSGGSGSLMNSLIPVPAQTEEEKQYITVPLAGVDDPELLAMLEEHADHAYTEPVDESAYFLSLILSYVLPLLLMVGLMMFLFRGIGGKGGMGGLGGVGKANAKVYVEKKTGVTFRDVAGQDEAKESLQEIIDILHNPQKYTEIGAKLPKGALLVGPPGTGKTLLAKAVAGEAGVPFFSISGSDFVEMFVGVGASQVHTRKIKLGEDVDLKKIALATAGTVGADLANLVNEAALRAVRHGRRVVTQEDLLASFEFVIAGSEKKNSVLTEFEKKLVAYHEVGHAMVAYKQKNAEPVQKITIVPHTEGSLGYTLLMPEEDKTNLRTKEELMAKITVSMGGRAAEQVVLNTMTNGASQDIQEATNLARNMVAMFGMSDEFGMMALGSIRNQYLDGGYGLDCAQDTAAVMDKAVKAILDQCYQDAVELIRENLEDMHKVVAYLLEKETITGGEMVAIIQGRDPALVEDAYASTHGRSRSLTGDIEPPAKNLHLVSEPVSAPQLPDGEPEQSGPEEPPAQPRDDETPPPQDGEGPNEKPEQDRP